MRSDTEKCAGHIRQFRYALSNSYGEGVHKGACESAACRQSNYSKSYHSVISHAHVDRYEYRYERIPLFAHTYCAGADTKGYQEDGDCDYRAVAFEDSEQEYYQAVKSTGLDDERCGSVSDEDQETDISCIYHAFINKAEHSERSYRIYVIHPVPRTRYRDASSIGILHIIIGTCGNDPGKNGTDNNNNE